jgi:hypothetical protein
LATTGDPELAVDTTSSGLSLVRRSYGGRCRSQFETLGAPKAYQESPGPPLTDGPIIGARSSDDGGQLSAQALLPQPGPNPTLKAGGGRLAEYSTPMGGAKNEDEIRMYRPNLYKSFLLTRLLVGVVGVLLPIVLVAVDVGSGEPVRGSLSAYHYHPSWLHVWFSGSLWAVGVGLMVYMGTRKSSIAGLISSFAGVAALVVSLFPTNDEGQPLTWISRVHYGAAAAVMVGLGLLCWGFGIYDKNRAGESETVNEPVSTTGFIRARLSSLSSRLSLREPTPSGRSGLPTVYLWPKR